MVKKMESNTNENWKNKGEKQDPTVSYRNFRLRFKVILVFGRGERECLRAYDRLHFNPSITLIPFKIYQCNAYPHGKLFN